MLADEYETPSSSVAPTCFIAMPISVNKAHAELYQDQEHWSRVMFDLFVPAVAMAGFQPLLPLAEGSEVIHERIIRNLMTADLVLCDLSGHNPNVFFELGIRTSLNMPVALVADRLTAFPFDVSSINTRQYDSNLDSGRLEEERSILGAHLIESAATSSGENTLWRLYMTSLSSRDSERELFQAARRPQSLRAQEALSILRSFPFIYYARRYSDAEVGIHFYSRPTDDQLLEVLTVANAHGVTLGWVSTQEEELP